MCRLVQLSLEWRISRGPPPLVVGQQCPWLHVGDGIMTLVTCYVSNHITVMSLIVMRRGVRD